MLANVSGTPCISMQLHLQTVNGDARIKTGTASAFASNTCRWKVSPAKRLVAVSSGRQFLDDLIGDAP